MPVGGRMGGVEMSENEGGKMGMVGGGEEARYRPAGKDTQRRHQALMLSLSIDPLENLDPELPERKELVLVKHHQDDAMQSAIPEVPFLFGFNPSHQVRTRRLHRETLEVLYPHATSNPPSWTLHPLGGMNTS